MQSIPDHPSIRMAERTGYCYPVAETEYECPHCGADLYPDDDIYKIDGETVGCQFCFNEDEWDEEAEKCEAEDMYG